jgi:hypothetical protein
MATGADQAGILLILRSVRLAENEQRNGIMTPVPLAKGLALVVKFPVSKSFL